MPRQTHTPLAVPGAYAGAGAALTFLAADVANKEQVTLTGTELIVARNVDGATPHAVTVTSVDDPFGRQENIAAESVAANGFRIFGPFKLPGWLQTDGNLYFEADNAQIEFAVIRL